MTIHMLVFAGFAMAKSVSRQVRQVPDGADAERSSHIDSAEYFGLAPEHGSDTIGVPEPMDSAARFFTADSNGESRSATDPAVGTWVAESELKRLTITREYGFFDDQQAEAKQDRRLYIVELPSAEFAALVAEIAVLPAVHGQRGRENTAQALLLYSGRVLLESAEEIYKQPINVTDGKITVIVSSMTKDKQPLQPPRERDKGTPAKTVFDLLEEGATLDDIREHIKASITPSPEKLGPALNKWLAKQASPDRVGPMPLAEKQGIMKFLTFVCEAIQQPLFWSGEECRVEAFGDADYEAGYIRVRAPGAKKGFTRANLSDILKEAPFGFDRESSLWPRGEEAATEQSDVGTSEDNANRRWSAKQAERKAKSEKKKPHR